MDTTVISASDALALVERQESHFWDHKSSQSGGATIQKIAGALANADGGEFIVGIEDRATGSGLDRWQGFAVVEDGNVVMEAIARDLSPAAPYTVEFLSIAGRETQGLACLVTIRKSENVHRTSAGKVFIRRNASSIEIVGQQVTDLALSKGARSYEDQSLGDYSLQDLVSEVELEYFLRSYSPATAPDLFATKQRLIDRDTGQARVASGLLQLQLTAVVTIKLLAADLLGTLARTRLG